MLMTEYVHCSDNWAPLRTPLVNAPAPGRVVASTSNLRGSDTMKRIAIALSLSHRRWFACGDAKEEKQHRKPPEEQVISEPAHGIGAILGSQTPITHHQGG